MSQEDFERGRRDAETGQPYNDGYNSAVVLATLGAAGNGSPDYERGWNSAQQNR